MIMLKIFFCYSACISIAELQNEKYSIDDGSQDRFVINLSKDQKDHYGQQFENEKPEAPGILGKL